MLKGLVTASLLAFSMAAAAEPWIRMDKGNPFEGGRWASCEIYNGEVLITSWNAEPVARVISIDEEKLSGLIEVASQAQWGTPAVHVLATFPAVTVTVGHNQSPGTKIYIDGSNIQSREGDAVNSLVRYAFETCGKFNP